MPFAYYARLTRAQQAVYRKSDGITEVRLARLTELHPLVGALDTVTAWSGDEYTWSFTGRNDVYTRSFADKMVKIGKVLRIADGDNRKLLVRGSSQ